MTLWRNIGWKGSLLIVGVWTLVALLISTQLYWLLQQGGNGLPWPQVFLIQLIIWYLWAAFTPIIVGLGQRIRIGGKRWWLAIGFHLIFSISWVLVFLIFYVIVFQWVGGIPISYESIVSNYPSFFLQLFHWDLIIYWAILGIGYAFDYYRQNRDRQVQTVQLESQLVQAQLQALKMQLQPHFLFNTLNTIAGMVRVEEKDAAIAMLAGLSDLLRQALARSDRQEVSLEEEMDFLKRYLEIEAIRFRDQLKLKIEVPEALLQARVPNLLLQPLVENAFHHGLAKKIGAGRLELVVLQTDNQLAFRIFNEGPPLDNMYESDSGIGLSNTRARLQQRYPNQHKLSLSNVEGGVQVDLEIPLELLTENTAHDTA